MPASRSWATVAPSARLESFLPSSPRISPWWTNSGGVAPERLEQPPVERLVRPVVVAADDVRDPEVDVVHDAREVVGRRAVLAHERDAVEALAELRARLEVPFSPLALAHRPFVPGEPEPLEVAQQRLLPARHVARRIGVVDPQQQTSPPSERFATALSALPTWSEPVGLGAKRLLTMRENLHGPLCRTLSKPEPGFERFGSRA